MSIKFFAAAISGALVISACQTTKVDPNKVLERYTPNTAEIVTSSNKQSGSYPLPEEFDHDFDVVAWENLIDVDFRTTQDFGVFTPAPVSEFSYYNDKFAEAVISEKGAELLPNGFAWTPEKRQIALAAGIQAYIENGPFQAFYIEITGESQTQKSCEADPNFMIAEQGGDYISLESECQEGKFTQSWYTFARGNVTRLLAMSTLGHSKDTESARSVSIHTVKVDGLEFAEHPLNGKLETRLAAVGDQCPFQRAQGTLDLDWSKRKFAGFIPANTGSQLKIKGEIDTDLVATVNIIEVGGIYNRDYRFPFVELQGNYLRVSDRWGCSFVMEMKLDGYYGELTDPF